MLGARFTTPVVLCAVLAGGRASTSPAAPAAVAPGAADPVRDGLNKAKGQRTEERNKAKAALIQAFDAQIKAAGAAGDLDTLKVLTTQKDAFTTAGILPNLPALKDAAAQYTQATRKADGTLVAAYETAIESYTNQSKPADALALRKERHDLLEGTADLPAADSPETIGLLLDRAKSDYQQTTEAAKKAFLQAIDTRVNAASDAGDLNGVKKLQAAKAAAESDAALPEGFNDAAVLSARSRYGLAVQAANQKLTTAYRDAIRNYTRARATDKAQAAQAELEATGLSAPAGAAGGTAAAGPSADNAVKLTRSLPTFLTATGAFSAEKEGIRLGKGVHVSTRAGDFLSKDYVFDVYVHIPKEDETVNVGLGDGTEKGSMRVLIRNDGGWGKRAFLTHGDQWGHHIGDIHANELYVVRIERHGGPVTASVGSITDGKFTADMSQTVSDPKTFVPDLAEKRAFLFFNGAAVFSEVRLATGAAAGSGAAGGGRSPFAPVKFPAPGAAGQGDAGAAGAAVAGAGGATGAAGAAEGTYRLKTDKLPAPFSATGTFSVSPAGIKPYDEKCLIITKEADFLSKDFLFETHVDVPRKQDWIIVGLGDGGQKESLRLVIRPDGNWGTRAFLTLGDEWGKNMGDVREAGTHVLRIERHGTAVTVSVGTEKDGKFEADLSQTVPDAKAAVPGLSERRAHLYFTGKTEWSEVKLVTGTEVGATPTAPPADKPVDVSKKGKGKKK